MLLESPRALCGFQRAEPAYFQGFTLTVTGNLEKKGVSEMAQHFGGHQHNLVKKFET